MTYDYICNFISKRNSVNLINCYDKINDKFEKIVLKDFTNNIESFNKELEISKLLYNNNITVPKIVNIKDNTVLYEYIDGSVLLDILERYENKSEKIDVIKIFDKLCIWLNDCYAVLKNNYGKTMILGDCHLRNFIYNNNTIYGVDFECVEEGSLEQDIAYLCIFTLTYSPMLTDCKYQITSFICRRCIELMNLNIDLLKKELNKQIQIVCNRRKIELPENIITNLFRPI